MSKLTEYQREVRAIAVIAWSVWNSNGVAPSNATMTSPEYERWSISSRSLDTQAKILNIIDDYGKSILADFSSDPFYGAYHYGFDKQFKFELYGSQGFRVEDLRSPSDRHYDRFEGEFASDHRVLIWPDGHNDSDHRFEFEIY